jgi:hypothetical protein
MHAECEGGDGRRECPASVVESVTPGKPDEPPRHRVHGERGRDM